jgi:hypothetical protein
MRVISRGDCTENVVGHVGLPNFTAAGSAVCLISEPRCSVSKTKDSMHASEKGCLLDGIEMTLDCLASTTFAGSASQNGQVRGSANRMHEISCDLAKLAK